MIVVDAGVIVAALGVDGPTGARALDRSREASALVAPELIDLEAVSAWRRLAAAGQIGEERVQAAIADLVALPMTRVSHRPLLHRCWELRANVTAYDAAYVALAESYGVTLVTTDSRLAAAPGPTCDIEVLD